MKSAVGLNPHPGGAAESAQIGNPHANPGRAWAFLHHNPIPLQPIAKLAVMPGIGKHARVEDRHVLARAPAHRLNEKARVPFAMPSSAAWSSVLNFQ